MRPLETTVATRKPKATGVRKAPLTPSRINRGTTETMAITAATKSGPRIWTTATPMVSPTGLMVSPDRFTGWQLAAQSQMSRDVVDTHHGVVGHNGQRHDQPGQGHHVEADAEP